MADKKKNKNDKTKNFLNIAGIRKIYKPKQKKGNNYSYEIIKKIGEGSYGVVYLINHKIKSMCCVLKKIDLKGLSEEEKKETYNEVNLLKKLDHPNIIKFIEVNKSLRYLEIITEFAEKGDLYNQICIQKKNKKRFPEKIIIDWLVQSCQALKYIHSKHIIHRDIKPQNIFLSNNGSIKLGDFGVSKTLNNTLEKAKTFVGTAYYLPPELINGKKYSYMADMWSLGISFYQLMTFKMPFDGDSIPAIMKKIIMGKEYPKINEKHYSKELINLVYKMMDSKPNNRPKPSDILNMDFIKNRILVYLKENKFDDILSKTIIKRYQDNYNKNDKDTDTDNNKNNDSNTINNKSNINNDNTNNNVENNPEFVSFKNKLKFNNIIGISKDIHTHKNDTKEYKDNRDNKDNEGNKDKQRVLLGHILLTDKKNNTKKSNTSKTSNNNSDINNNNNSNKNNNSNNNKEKEVNKLNNIQNEIPKIKIKIISPSTSNKKNSIDKNINNKIDNNDKNTSHIKENDNNKKEINNDMTIKTNKASYNPDESKYGFETKFIKDNLISHDGGDKELNLENMNEEFLFETNKKIEMKQNSKDEYDLQRNMNLLNSLIVGKDDNEVENENKLINYNESDIEENEKENEEDEKDKDDYNKGNDDTY